MRLTLYSLLVSVVAFSVWIFVKHTEQKGYDKAIAEVRQVSDAEKKQYQKNLNEVMTDALRKQKLAASDAAIARSESNKLREQVATLRGNLYNLPEASLKRYTETLGDVFTDCIERYTSLAKQADGLNADREALNRAWPN